MTHRIALSSRSLWSVEGVGVCTVGGGTVKSGNPLHCCLEISCCVLGILKLCVDQLVAFLCFAGSTTTGDCTLHPASFVPMDFTLARPVWSVLEFSLSSPRKETAVCTPVDALLLDSSECHCISTLFCGTVLQLLSPT